MRRANLLFLLLLILSVVPRVPARAATIVPFGAPQAAPRTAAAALFAHIGAGQRAQWAQRGFTVGATSYAAGTVIAPDGIAGTIGYTSAVMSSTTQMRPALALQATGTSPRIAVLRSTVGDPAYGTAAWELADIRTLFDSYLWNAVQYDVLDEAALSQADLTPYSMIIAPAVRRGNEAEVVARLGSVNTAKLKAFVKRGGTLYAQGNGAIVAEAAGVVPAGTVDLSATLHLAAGQALNRGQLAIVQPQSPLALSLITDTLYLLDDPILKANGSLATVARYTNTAGGNQPAVLAGNVGAGRVVLVNAHPTAAQHREQVQLLLNALLWSFGQPAELVGDAVQTYNPKLDPHLVPAYEPGTPISATRTFRNLWDTPLSNVVITETVEAGFQVLTNTVQPAATLLPQADGRTAIVWQRSSVAPGELALRFTAVTRAAALRTGEVTFATSTATYAYQEASATTHGQPLLLRARMPARLQADRDIEADRQYTIPAEGLYLDTLLPLENKEDSLASQVVVTDVVPLIAPIVNMEDQETILAQNNGETIWVRHEPFFYNEPGAPFRPANGYKAGNHITLDDWDGTTWTTFKVPYGTHGEVWDPNAMHTKGVGNYITIPLSYTNAITLTADGTLKLPAKVLTWTLDLWPGYHYEEPALRYGIHTSELFGRAVTFAGDPGDAPNNVVISTPAGSIYTHLGGAPVQPTGVLSTGLIYVPQAPVTPEITYRDEWNRLHRIPLRAAFFDVFNWAACTCGTSPSPSAGLNVTFQMRADLHQRGTADDPTLLFPSRLARAEVDVLIKATSLGASLPANELLVDMAMFKGLGIEIAPRSGDWTSSWEAAPGVRLLAMNSVSAYNHLLFQHNLPAGQTVAITLHATITGDPEHLAEGMLKLHDGARFSYRDASAGPSRYEIQDTHVQGILGVGTQAQVHTQAVPTEVNTQGDTTYLIYRIDDPNDPRMLTRNGPGDPFLQTYGFGDLAATIYVGGRDNETILHSVVAPGEHTRVRIELNNNRAAALTGVRVTPQPLAGITVTPVPASTLPTPDMPFLDVTNIPEAGRGVYLFDVVVDATYSGPRGQVVELPFSVTGDNLPATFAVPPARLGITDATGRVATAYSPAHTLTLADSLPDYVQLSGAALVRAADVQALTGATSTPARTAAWSQMTQAIPVHRATDGVVTYQLPGNALDQLYDPAQDHRVFVVAQATFVAPNAGMVPINGGAGVTYADDFGMTWHATALALTAEAHGAGVRLTYSCTGVIIGTIGTEPAPDTADAQGCVLEPGVPNTVRLTATVTNVGDYPAQNVTATLQLAPDAAFVPPTHSRSGTMAWTIGDLAPGASEELPITVQVTPTSELTVAAATPSADALIMQAGDGAFTDARSQQRFAGALGAAFRLPVRVMTTPTTPELPIVTDGAGIHISYDCTNVTTSDRSTQAPCILQAGATNTVLATVTLQNTGSAAAQGLRATLRVPAGATILASDPSALITGEGLVWDVGQIAAGHTSVLHLRLAVTVPDVDGATGQSPTLHTLIEAVDTAFVDGASARQRAEQGASAYQLAVTPIDARQGAAIVVEYACDGVQPATANCTVQEGQATDASIRIIATNHGDAPANGLALTVVLAPGTTLRDSQPRTTVTGTQMNWIIGDLAPGSTATIHLTLRLTGKREGNTSTIAMFTRTDGQFTDVAHPHESTVSLGGGYTLPLRIAQESPPMTIYLPLLGR